jgi:rare lipoprotein A
MVQEQFYRRSAILLVLTTAACAGTPSAGPREPGERQGRETRAAEPVKIPADVANPDLIRGTPLVLEKSSSEVDAVAVLATSEGEATYYASKFEGRRTASGIVFTNSALYAAHRTLPFGTLVRVTNLRNDRSVTVRVVDRGPWGSPEHRRRTIIDVSQRAANELDFIRRGRVRVRVEVLEWGDTATQN